MKGMTFLIDDGRLHSALCFVAAPGDFGAWFTRPIGHGPTARESTR